ncbi:uncharacterized protein LOC123531296 [Mercenaria mercenaria]|uniref:uncharacterized protein LOC123531296 n=1 Tax=Mercenaria mercenaria TaxID=6596 RepID=UPI00234F49C3|nr:uncharacterized protein LOC123531296 [Mercenaria mercenaria]
MFIACRTEPNQSYNNPAERVMSLLNIGLQNVSLSRAEMDAGNEMLMKSMTSLKKIRNCGKPSLQKALQESVVTMCIVKDIFARLQRKHGTVSVQNACTEEEISDLSSMMRLIAMEDVDPKKKFSQNERLYDFVKRHCRERHYVFQIKKCDLQNVETCQYCCLSLPRILEDNYRELHFLPDPVLDQDENYKIFNEVYGTETTESDRPSLKPKFEALYCVECGKRRVVYCKTSLTRPQEQLIIRVQEELLYVCGNPLFPRGPMQDILIVREGLSCSFPIEVSYYAGITQTFDEICFFCGDVDILRNDEINQLKEDFSIVRPVCNTCFTVKHLKPATRNAKKNQKTEDKIKLIHELCIDHRNFLQNIILIKY